ncbi:hypothetical protein MLD38_005491 [Melastoma candidum]|uniref:Uncharacterized protein n=1 Tax=Melastoma candidum TaxID=119954 RepID=A0ACB9RL33_9MYRT|nr:hypothetical protein MLD38_005491 [Melastoma candidum]
MVEELGVFIPYVGDVEHAHDWVADERKSDLVEHFIPLVKRLAAASGSRLESLLADCSTLYTTVPQKYQKLSCVIYTTSSAEMTCPMVRRSDASNLGKFAATVEYTHLKAEIMSIFEDLTQDVSIIIFLEFAWLSDWIESGFCSLIAVEGCAALGKFLEPQDCGAHVLPVIVNFSQDKSWRVRYTVENQLYELFEAVGPEPTKTGLVPAYLHLLRDNEAEVRIAAAGKVTKFCHILSPELAIQHVIPCVKELSSDSSQHVHSALASVIMGMTPVLRKDATIEHLLPIFRSLLKDEFPDVRLNIISKLGQVNQHDVFRVSLLHEESITLTMRIMLVIGIDLLLQSLLPAIVELAEDRHWRVRLAIIEYIPLLASQLGVGFFDDKLGSLCLQWLQDKVNLIQDAAANNLKRLAEEFGPEWRMRNLSRPIIIDDTPFSFSQFDSLMEFYCCVLQTLDMINNPHYLYRMTILQAISLLVPVLGSEITCSSLLLVVIQASKDRA